MSLGEAAKVAGCPYRTAAWWIEQGLITPPGYDHRRGVVIKINGKVLREICLLTRLRKLVSLQELRKALKYLRGLGHNPLSTGDFVVVGGKPGDLEVIKICSRKEAISLIGKHTGQLVFVPLGEGEKV